MKILEIKEKFERNQWNLVQDFAAGKLDDLTWLQISEKYNIKPLGTDDQKRKASNDVWRKYLRLVEKTSNLEEERNKIPKILTLDIETSYNIIRSFFIGRKVSLPHDSIIQERKILSVAYKWLHEDDVTFLQWDENQDDKILVEELVKVMNMADEIVGHNCDSYDIPFITGRAVFHDIPTLAKYKSTDTLKLARKHRFNNMKLDYLADFFGFGRKVQHKGIELWDDIILRKDPKAMEEMMEYNVHDVVLTEKVYLKLKKYSENNIHHTALNGGDKHACPMCGNTEEVKLLKTFVTKAGTKSRLMGCSCGTQFKLSDKLYKDNYE